MSASASTQWFWSDWLGDIAVRQLTLAERGLWIDLLALMAAASPAGYLCDGSGNPLTNGDIARLTNAPSAEEVGNLIASILRKGVASRDRAGRLFNRRMTRDAQKRARDEAISAKRAANGRLGGAATRLKWNGDPDLPRQKPQQLPRHSLDNHSIPKEEISSGWLLSERPGVNGKVAVRYADNRLEKQPRPDKPPVGGESGLLAQTASRPPRQISEEVLASILAKSPSRRTMAEITALMEHKRALDAAAPQEATNGRLPTGHEHLLATRYLNGDGR